uniref:Zn(2)-C6 fungal-type domain-containing protein n=1 Tax=Ganoderma boninense TaxID=34458 RepID=A0A5K1JYX0_9APHY|nr:Zn(2)-C6 fungal-type domain-containing protein [Ganoderma boninense]
MYIFENFTLKVRYWFQNHAPVKKTRLPLSINHDFHPERVWGMRHKNDIRSGLQESIPDTVDADAPYVVQWNAKRKEMWHELSDEEKLIYKRLAVEWSLHGPDDDLKPDMAERRSVAWMKAVTLLFWQQCRMPIFIYGCFEDTKAELQGATFDTSLLFEDTDEWRGKPTFRSSKDWATDFRRYFYEFFTGYIRPDLASPDAMEYLRTTSKKVVEPFDFERTDEGWPLLPVAASSNTARRQEILRLWMRELYGASARVTSTFGIDDPTFVGFACGQEVLSVPWTSVTKVPDKFFDPGMLPPNFTIGDPSHIPRDPLGRFYDHVHKIQNGDVPDIPRFQFAHYEIGPESNREYPDAINTCDVTPWQRKRAKKKVNPPKFDAPPGNTDEEGDVDDAADDESDTVKPAKKGVKRALFKPGKKFYKQVEKLRKEKERAKARKDKAEAKAAKKANARARKGKGKAKGGNASSGDEDEWSEQEETPEEEEIVDFDAMDHDVPVDESEESAEDEPLSHSAEVPGDASDDSGEEVEGVLERYEDVLSSSAVRKSAARGARSSSTFHDSISNARVPPPPAQAEEQRRQPADTGEMRLPSSPVGDDSSPPPPKDERPRRSGQSMQAKASTQANPAHSASHGPSTHQASGEAERRHAADSNVAAATASRKPKPKPRVTKRKAAALADSPGNSKLQSDASSHREAAMASSTLRQSAGPIEHTPADDVGPVGAGGGRAPVREGAATVAAPSQRETVLGPSTPGTLTADAGPSAALGLDSDVLARDDDEWHVPTGVHLPPAHVPAHGPARLQYLRSLDSDSAYLNMLERAQGLLSETAAIRVQPPLFWASWGHKSPFLPREAHIPEKGPKTVQSIMNFLKKGVGAGCKPADAQRYCLVMGMVLKNIAVLHFLEPGDDWPESLPKYMETSALTFDMRAPLLAICATLFPPSSALASTAQPVDKEVVAERADGGPARKTANVQRTAAGSATGRTSRQQVKRQRDAPEELSPDDGPSNRASGASAPEDDVQPTQHVVAKAKRGTKKRTAHATGSDKVQRASTSAEGRASSSATPADAAPNPLPAIGARRSSRLRK